MCQWQSAISVFGGGGGGGEEKKKKKVCGCRAGGVLGVPKIKKIGVCG